MDTMYPEVEDEICDEMRSSMTFETVVEEIKTLYPRGIPETITSILLKKMLSRSASKGFAYTTIYVPTVINATLAE